MTSARSMFHKTLIFAILLILVLASTAGAESIGTIKLKSGEIYKDVPFEVNDFYKTVLFRYQGQRINIEFERIESISESKAKDITNEILHKPFSGRPEEIKPVPSIDVSIIKTWTFTIALGGNFSIPGGSYYNGLKAGVGFDGDIRFKITERIAWQLIISRSGMGAGEDMHLISNSPRYTVVGEDVYFHTTRFAMAINFCRPLFNNGPTNSMAYSLFGAGIINHAMGASALVRDNNNNTISTIHSSVTDSRVGLVFGGGLIVQVQRRAGLDFSTTVDMVSTPKTGESSGAIFAFIVDIKLSIVGMF